MRESWAVLSFFSTRNCFTFTFNFIVMEMKNICEKGKPVGVSLRKYKWGGGGAGSGNPGVKGVGS